MSVKKLNEALGINSVDELIQDLKIDGDIRQLTEMEEQMRENVEKIDSQIQQYNETGLQNINVSDLNSSLSEIRDLITISKDTIKHVYDSIVDSELVDSEMVQALSKLIESSHLTVKEYIDIFKDRVAFYDKVRLEAIKNQYKIQQMNLKHKLDLERMEKAQEKNNITQVNSETTPFSQEDIIKALGNDSEI